MPSVNAQLKRLEAESSSVVRACWLYVGGQSPARILTSGDGVYRLFLPHQGDLPPGCLALLRHPDPAGDTVSAAAAAWVLGQLRPNLRQTALIQAARILVLVTAGTSAEPWPDDDLNLNLDLDFDPDPHAAAEPEAPP